VQVPGTAYHFCASSRLLFTFFCARTDYCSPSFASTFLHFTIFVPIPNVKHFLPVPDTVYHFCANTRYCLPFFVPVLDYGSPFLCQSTFHHFLYQHLTMVHHFLCQYLTTFYHFLCHYLTMVHLFFVPVHDYGSPFFCESA